VNRHLPALAVALVAATALSGCLGPVPADFGTSAWSAARPAASATPEASVTPAASATPGAEPPAAYPPAASAARALLETLPVKGRAPKTGYDREAKFGSAWLDVDRNGCDQRNDILARDLTEVSRPAGCRVLSGTLHDGYTGKVIDFVRGNDTSRAVQIDHIVALSNAWQTGAQQLSQEQRVQLANDPLNLRAVDGPTNAQKGDGDAATWLPPQRGFRCAYVSAQIEVKAKYALWVTQPERDAMVRVLDTCGVEAAAADTAQ